MIAKADPVLTLWQRHRQAWTLVHSLAANAPLSSDAFDVADKIDLEIAKTTATTIDGVLNQARLLSQWDEATDWQDARTAIIGHFILAGLKFLVRDDYQEQDLGSDEIGGTS